MFIEELTPSTNHEYISVKYHGKNERGYKQNNLINDHTPVQQNKDTPSTKFVHTSTPLQASSSLTFSGGGGILTNDHTPIIAGDDTNILRVNNINNNTPARIFTDKNDKTDFTDKNNDINKPTHTNSDEIKTCNEEEKSSYADLAFGFPAEPTQSASDEWEESKSDNLLALLNEEQADDFEIPLDSEDIIADELDTQLLPFALL